MRVTRARAQQSVEETTTTEQERAPLVEISPNASPDLIEATEELPKKAVTRSKSKKGAKKGAKGKKAKAVEEEEPVQVVSEDERQAAASPAAEAVLEGPVKEIPDTSIPAASNDERPTSPESKPVRLTRRQLAKQEEDLRQSQQAPSQPVQPEIAVEEVAATQPQTTTIESNTVAAVQDAHSEGTEDKADEVQETVRAVEEAPQEQYKAIPETDIPQTVEPATENVVEPPIEENTADSPVLSVECTPEPKSLRTERPIEDTLSPAASRTPSRRRASRSPSKSPMRIEESIEALDALEEALEDVGKAVSHFDQSNDEKSPRKKNFPREAATPKARGKTTGKTPLTQRISKTPNAAPSSAKPTKSSLARASSVRTLAAKDASRKGSAETTDYLASKRRPISVSFPTPPPPPKGRAPTRPAFQLSSETVAAKLKAQREERLKREAEREAQGTTITKQRPASVHLAPTAKSTKAPTKASFQLPGEAVAAKLKAQREERMKREAEGSQDVQVKSKPRPISMPPPAKSTKPLTKASFQLPGEAIAAKLKAQREERQKREEEAEAAKKSAAAAKPATMPIRKTVALPSRTPSGVTIPPPPKPESSSSSTTSKRNSIQLSRSTSISTTNSSSNRNSALISKSVVTPVDAAQQKLKGREVFMRDKYEKDSKDQERREKEEAAKKARADAAERGRIASREWAERQRKKMMDAVRSKAGGA